MSSWGTLYSAFGVLLTFDLEPWPFPARLLAIIVDSGLDLRACDASSRIVGGICTDGSSSYS